MNIKLLIFSLSLLTSCGSKHKVQIPNTQHRVDVGGATNVNINYGLHPNTIKFIEKACKEPKEGENQSECVERLINTFSLNGIGIDEDSANALLDAIEGLEENE